MKDLSEGDALMKTIGIEEGEESWSQITEGIGGNQHCVVRNETSKCFGQENRRGSFPQNACYFDS